MKSNNTYKTSQIIDMLDSITERIDDIEKLLITKYSKVEDWTTAGLTEEEKEYFRKSYVLDKKEWVCQVCGKSTFETDYDYIVHPKLCLGCALKEEFKSKNIKEQQYYDHGITSKTAEKYSREAEACSTQQPYTKYKKRLSDSWMGPDYKKSYNIEDKEEYKRWKDSWIKEVDRIKKEETSKSEDDFWTKVTNGMKNLLKSPWEK